MSGLLAAFIAELGLITWRAFGTPIPFQGQQQGGSTRLPPLPSEFAAAVAVYGGLSLLGDASATGADVATVLGWGFVIATFLNLAPGIPGNTTTPPGKLPSSNGLLSDLGLQTTDSQGLTLKPLPGGA